MTYNPAGSASYNTNNFLQNTDHYSVEHTPQQVASVDRQSALEASHNISLDTLAEGARMTEPFCNSQEASYAPEALGSEGGCGTYAGKIDPLENSLTIGSEQQSTPWVWIL